MENNIGKMIAERRKALGLTQQKLAEELHISFQAVSKWENGTSSPDISLLPKLAQVLGISVDALVGYSYPSRSGYDEKYRAADYYWGTAPNRLCYEVMKLRPPTKPYRVLDIGCGEGQNAVFFARNGYLVSAFDIAETGLEKARELAQNHHTDIHFFRADINDYTPHAAYDIVFSSGVFHYMSSSRRKTLIGQLKEHTAPHGIHVINVFVRKPFIDAAPDLEKAEKQADPWYSGELFGYYHDWLIHKCEEVIFPCSSGGTAHRHCMDILIAEKV